MCAALQAKPALRFLMTARDGRPRCKLTLAIFVGCLLPWASAYAETCTVLNSSNRPCFQQGKTTKNFNGDEITYRLVNTCPHDAHLRIITRDDKGRQFTNTVMIKPNSHYAWSCYKGNLRCIVSYETFCPDWARQRPGAQTQPATPVQKEHSTGAPNQGSPSRLAAYCTSEATNWERACEREFDLDPVKKVRCRVIGEEYYANCTREGKWSDPTEKYTEYVFGRTPRAQQREPSRSRSCNPIVEICR